VAAGAGCAVAKHGNRSATSLSGSADLLEALGARIDLDAEAVARCIDEVGFGFMFAPAHHQATRFVVGVRRELAVRTIFNLLGPLTNPAGARRQLLGVFDERFLETIAGALAQLGSDRALVVSSEDGFDEISATAPTHIVEVNGEELRRYTLDPADVGVSDRSAAPSADGPVRVGGGTPEQNAVLTRAILDGQPTDELHSGAAELVVINAGAAIYVAGRAATIAEGVEAAREALASGAAATALERYVCATGGELGGSDPDASDAGRGASDAEAGVGSADAGDHAQAAGA
jgi:anthranilate phosphoribosyltransferase